MLTIVKSVITIEMAIVCQKWITWRNPQRMLLPVLKHSVVNRWDVIWSKVTFKYFPSAVWRYFPLLSEKQFFVHGRHSAPPCCQINWDIYWLDFSAFLWYSPSQKWRRTFLAVNTCPRWTSHLLPRSFASSPAVLHLVTGSPHFYGYFTWYGRFHKLKSTEIQFWQSASRFELKVAHVKFPRELPIVIWSLRLEPVWLRAPCTRFYPRWASLGVIGAVQTLHTLHTLIFNFFSVHTLQTLIFKLIFQCTLCILWSSNYLFSAHFANFDLQVICSVHTWHTLTFRLFVRCKLCTLRCEHCAIQPSTSCGWSPATRANYNVGSSKPVLLLE